MSLMFQPADLCVVKGSTNTADGHRSAAPASSARLLAALLVLLETKAGPPAQFALLLGVVIGPRGAGSRLQDVVHLQTNRFTLFKPYPSFMESDMA